MELSFFFFLILSLISSVGVISSTNPLNSVLFLILSFLNAACSIVLLGADFIGLIFVIIYVGAVAVLFLFIVMMLDIKVLSQKESNINFFSYGPFVLLYGLCFLISIYNIFYGFFPKSPKSEVFWYKSFDSLSSIDVIGQALFRDYGLCVLLCGLLLLVSMIGAIVLALDLGEKVMAPNITRQISRDVASAMVFVSSDKQKTIAEEKGGLGLFESSSDEEWHRPKKPTKRLY